MNKVQRFVDEIIADRKLHPICQTCGHGKDQHAFDIYPMKNPNKPCELSCMVCFDEETERLKKTQEQKRLPFGKSCSDCQFFKTHCEWLLSRNGNEEECDWIPSKFREISLVKNH